MRGANRKGDVEIGVVVEEPVDDVRRLARGRRQKLGVERRVATGEVGVEGDDGLRPCCALTAPTASPGPPTGKCCPSELEIAPEPKNAASGCLC